MIDCCGGRRPPLLIVFFMRKIDLIIIHCSATAEGKDFRAADIDRWHRQQGFKSIGYHFVVRLNGEVERGRPIAEVGAHCKGHNATSIGVCYIGGLDADGNKPKDTRTVEQRKAMRNLVKTLKHVFPRSCGTVAQGFCCQGLSLL